MEVKEQARLIRRIENVLRDNPAADEAEARSPARRAAVRTKEHPLPSTRILPVFFTDLSTLTHLTAAPAVCVRSLCG